MRACFLGQNICNLGYGVAILQAPRLVMDEPAPAPAEADRSVGADQQIGQQLGQHMVIPKAPIGSRPVANPPRLEV